MKLKQNTILLILLSIILGSGVYLFEMRNQKQQQQTITQQKNIFNFKSQNIKNITINYSNLTLKFVVINNNWKMSEPEQTIVNDGVMAFLLDLIVKGKSDRFFFVCPDKLSQYGLEPPLGTITIELANGHQQQILLGKETIDSNLIYARVVSPQNQSDPEILLVSKNWQYAVDRDIGEWKSNN